MASSSSRPMQEARVPPADIDAEKSVLGSVLLSNDAYPIAVQWLRPECFYSDANRRIFQAIVRLQESGGDSIDVVTVANELRTSGDFQEVGGASYLNDVLGTVPHAAHVEYYAKIVRDKWLSRCAIEVCERLVREGYDETHDVHQLLSLAEQRIVAICELQLSKEPRGLNVVVQDAISAIIERMASDGELVGVETGSSKLNGLTGGWHPDELIVLAARPSMGKTAYACNLVMAAATSGVPVLFFSLEQSEVELAERMLCIHSRFSATKVRKGELTGIDQVNLANGVEEIKPLPIYLDDTASVSISRLSAIARRAQQKWGIGLVVIDYLQLINADTKGTPTEQRIEIVSRRLKLLAKDLHVPVIALAQLNRGLEGREEKRPRLSDLRGSGSIEQDADMVMFLHRPEVYKEGERPGEADIVIAKNRHGSIGVVTLAWQKESMRFVDLDQRLYDDF